MSQRASKEKYKSMKLLMFLLRGFWCGSGLRPQLACEKCVLIGSYPEDWTTWYKYGLIHE